MHTLKIIKPHFEAVASGEKKAEYRLDDRDFEKGEMIFLQEFSLEDGTYTGRYIITGITHVLDSSASALPAGYVVLSMKLCSAELFSNSLAGRTPVREPLIEGAQ